MQTTINHSFAPGLALLTGIIASLALSAQGVRAENNRTEPVLVELFTSQSCSSCISATKYFGELTEREDIVALSWHVDYWNLLPTRFGRWEDPFSSAENTARQRDYNKNIRKRSSVYTPQMVVAGAREAIGSNREKVSVLIDAAHTNYQPGSISSRRQGDQISFDVDKCETDGEAYLVTFLPEATTNIERGENAGHAFKERNVVSEMRALGAAPASGAKFTAPAPEAGYGCALIIQEPGQGRILAARYCAAS